MINGKLKVFSGRNNKILTDSICSNLGIESGVARTELFPDGELLVKIEEDVRGRDCYIVISTSNPVNDNFMELLIFADTMKRSSAGKITAVIPYYGYARQDRKAQGRTPITAKLCANLITTAGCDRVVTLDLHSAQIQGFFDLPVDHLAAAKVFYDYFQPIREELGDLVIVSPDIGNVKVANDFADLLQADIAIIDKRRVSGNDTVINNIVGNVANKNVLMIDDMISTGGTMCNAAEVVMEKGANKVWIAATHGVFSGESIQRIANSCIERVVVTDTIPRKEELNQLGNKLIILSVAELLSAAIRHIHNNESVSALFKGSLGSKR